MFNLYVLFLYPQSLPVFFILYLMLVFKTTNRPLDLCDAMTPNPDALSIGYSGSHASGLMLPNHPSSIGPTLPTGNMNTRLPGSPGMVLGNTLPSPSTPNTPR